MTDRLRSGGRIVVALDAIEGNDFALELACCVSESVSPELLGLFVENARLLDYARSRLAREITRSGRERPLERLHLERALREQSAQARLRFEQAAARLGLRHSFRVTRGELAVELLRQAAEAEAEALILSLAEHVSPPDAGLVTAVEQLVGSDLPVLLFARAGWTRGHSIAIVVEDPGVPHASLRAAARLAKQSRSPLTVLLTGRALAERAAAAERAAETAADAGAEIGDVIAVNALTAEALARAMRVCQARLLVLPGGETRSEAPLIVELLRGLPSALMLVRG